MAASVLFETSSSSSFSSKFSQYQNDALVSRTNPETYKDICVVKVLSKAKFSVYLVNSQVTKQNFAMKVFPFSASNKPHSYFENEARFAFMNHQNVIRTHHVERQRETISKGTTKKVSYTIMEYAPNGDFFDLVMKYGKDMDDKLIRTYFRQLVEGLEYLHKNGVSHMDLKLENLLVGEDFSLKIADFDLSHIAGDSKVMSKGTKFYRAPEVIQERCINTNAADVYSAGIILFTMKTKGMLPHAEDNRVNGIDFAGLLYTNTNEFWNKHCEIQKVNHDTFDQDFKDLFTGMIRLNPSERLTIQQIKKSKWYNGPVYTAEELRTKVGRFYGF